jgi:hypothetical protein
MHRIAFLALLTTASVASADARDPIIAPDGRTFAVVVVRERFDECSNAGGEHYIFDVDLPASSSPMKAHAGGHSIYMGLLPDGGLHRTASKEQWYVAEITIAPRLSEDRDGNPDSSVSGWCLDRVPRTQASVSRLIPVADRDAGRTLLGTIGVTGLPRAQVTYMPARSHESLAIVRVVERVAADATRFRVDVVNGRSPDVIDFGPLPVWTGDLVVVVVDTTDKRPVITRALIADNLADAVRWKAAVVAGWPPDSIVAGWGGAYAVARWTAVGKVKRGSRRCGAELVLSTWQGSSFQIEPTRVAAPAGTRARDVITAVVVPQPADSCGRTAHIVRAYKTPGATYATANAIVAGTKAPSAPIVE